MIHTMKRVPILLQVLPLLLAILTTAACNRDMYQTAAYKELSGRHHRIAVLPAETITSGRVPADLTEEMIAQIEENESHAFQTALFDQFTRQTGRPERYAQVEIQHYAETNALLEKANISTRDSWRMSPTELAQALGVDAVVRTTVRKQWYLTDLESFGLSLARSIVFLFSNGPWWFIPNDRTSDVIASAAIIDGRNGAVVWNTQITRSTDWNSPHSDIVRNISRVLARRFPYRP